MKSWIKKGVWGFLIYLVLFFVISLIWSNAQFNESKPDYRVNPGNYYCSDILGGYGKCHFGEFFLTNLFHAIFFSIPVVILYIIFGKIKSRKK